MSDCEHLWATQDEIGRPYCQGCGKPWEQVRKEEAMNDVKELRAEIDRLQDAKRAALKLADERAREANGLRALLKQAQQFVHDSGCDEDDADVSRDREALLRRIDAALTDEVREPRTGAGSLD